MCLIYSLKVPSEKRPIIALGKYQEGTGNGGGPLPSLISLPLLHQSPHSLCGDLTFTTRTEDLFSALTTLPMGIGDSS